VTEKSLCLGSGKDRVTCTRDPTYLHYVRLVTGFASIAVSVMSKRILLDLALSSRPESRHLLIRGLWRHLRPLSAEDLETSAFVDLSMRCLPCCVKTSDPVAFESGSTGSIAYPLYSLDIEGRLLCSAKSLDSRAKLARHLRVKLSKSGSVLVCPRFKISYPDWSG
jgi:hypothetical protein